MRRSWKEEGASGSAGPWGKRAEEMERLRSSSSGFMYSSRRGLDGTDDLAVAGPENHVDSLPPAELAVELLVKVGGAMRANMPASVCSWSCSVRSFEGWDECDGTSPIFTGAEAPLNQSANMVEFRDLEAPDGTSFAEEAFEGIKLARDFVGEWRIELRVFCWTEEAARDT